MRFWITAVALSALFVLLAINAVGILDGGSGLSAEELIEASRGNFHFDFGFPETPQESRRIWSRESGVDFSMPGRLSESATTPEESRADYEAGDQGQTSDADSGSVVTPSQPAAELPARSMAGNWSFYLEDDKNRVMALRLFQSEDAVFGSGTMNDGSDTLRVLASGSLAGDKLSLDVVSDGTTGLYRFNLTTRGSSASGRYAAFSSSGERWEGQAEGMLTTPS